MDIDATANISQTVITPVKPKHTRPKLGRLAFGIGECAEALGVSPGFIRLEILRGKLAAVRAGRRVLVKKDSLEKYLAAESMADG